MVAFRSFRVKTRLALGRSSTGRGETLASLLARFAVNKEEEDHLTAK